MTNELSLINDLSPTVSHRVFIEKVFAAAEKMGSKLSIEPSDFTSKNGTSITWSDGHWNFGLSAGPMSQEESIYQAARCYNMTKNLGITE